MYRLGFIMCIKNIKRFVNKELKIVDDNILFNLRSNIGLITDIANYIILRGGKRVRPLVTILLGKALDCKDSMYLVLAGAIELIHTATLLHDDVVDCSERRRGSLTVNQTWGNQEAILVGDFLYTRAFQIMVSVNDIRILTLMSDTTNIISEGEVGQLLNKKNFKISENEYLSIIKCKTAQLFAASASIGAILANSNVDIYNAVIKYGMHIGIAYQLIDDVLDYIMFGDNPDKNIGDDFFEGIFTLPLIYTLNICKTSEKNIILDILNNKQKDRFIEIIRYVVNIGAIKYTINMAKFEVEKAKRELLLLPRSKYVTTACELADFIVSRKY